MEKIISFETAKLAKEKGFDESSLWYYYTEKIHDRPIGYLSSNTGSSNDQIFIRDNKTVYAPTQSLLQKWLREKYNIHIIIDPIKENESIAFIPTVAYSELVEDEIEEDIPFKTYEEALEDALKDALGLIK